MVGSKGIQDMQTLGREDTQMIKAFAIIFIVLHNFAKQFPWVCECNEKVFRIQHTQAFFNNVLANNHIFDNLLSFWGWGGVSIFVFITGYGLAKSYDTKAISNWGAFKNSIVKLWKLLLPLIPLWLLITSFQYSISEGISFGEAFWYTLSVSWLKIITQVFFIDMLIPQFRGDGLLGTWWYFSLTAQLYAIYFFFIRGKKNYRALLLFFLSILIQGVLVYYDQMGILHFVRSNFVGWMLPFCIGIIIGRYGFTPHRPYILLMVSFWGLVVCEFNGYLWIFKSVFSIGFWILSFQVLYSVISKCRSSLVWVGGVSPSLFATHLFVRNIMILYGITSYIIYLVGSFLLAISYSFLCSILYGGGIMHYKYKEGCNNKSSK